MQKIRTLVLLLLAYAAATWFPAPGLWLRALSFGSEAIQLPQILLATLLLSAGVCSSRDALRSILRMRSAFYGMALAAWLLPLVATTVGILMLWGLFHCPASVALGMLIIAAMPVANSSVGWSSSIGGSVVMSIALLVIATALSPLLTPMVINFGAAAIGTAEQALTQTPWSDGMGWFFLTWVLVPVLVGVLVASRLRPEQSRRLKPNARRISFAILILLNYLNGAACLPALVRQPHLLWWPIAGAATVLAMSFVTCRLLLGLRPFRRDASCEIDAAERVSLLLAVMMRNTGAALVFAGAALPDFAAVSITIIAYTLLQHLSVGFFLASKRQATPQLVCSGLAQSS
jgi:BASS family bile acid:Na+ symporter